MVFGVCLIAFVLALRERTRTDAPVATTLASGLGLIWAGSLVASGMVANAGLPLALGLYEKDPAQAALTWSQIEAVASGLGNGNCEILGGLMTLLFGVAELKSSAQPRLIGVLGILVGLVGVASLAPGFSDLAGVFGLGQGAWFVWLAIVMIGTRAGAASAPVRG